MKGTSLRHQNLHFGPFTWFNLSVVNVVPRLVDSSALPPRPPQIFHNALVAIARTAVLPHRFFIALTTKHERYLRKSLKIRDYRDMDLRPQAFIQAGRFKAGR